MKRLQITSEMTPGQILEIQAEQKKIQYILVAKEDMKGSIETIARKLFEEVFEELEGKERIWGERRGFDEQKRQTYTFHCNIRTRETIEMLMQDEQFNSVVEFKEA